jgi:3-hydroxyisobutyrate dehydrogenase-like beta-hydroxyacid dehydrogenase
LAAAGHNLVVFNRTAAKADPLIAMGARRVNRPGYTASTGGIVISMVADDAALDEIVSQGDSIAERLAPGGIHISMSTVSPEVTRRLAKYHREFGSTMIAAPVFGRPNAAAAKQLWIALSGEARARETARPLLEAMGRKIFEFGDDPGAANVVKLAGNFMIAAAIEAMGEALAMSEKSGVDRDAVISMLAETIFAAPVYQGYGRTIASDSYSPAGFRLRLGKKDIELVLRASEQAGAPMPIASLLRDRFVGAIAKGRGELDWAAIALGALDDAGIKRGD